MKKEKPFLEELEEHKKKTDSKRRGVVAVLAQKENIEQGLAAGFTLNDIHAVLSNKGQMPVTYSAFVKLVRKYIKGIDKPKTITVQETERVPRGAKEVFETEKKGSVRYNPDNHDPDKLIG